MIGHMTASIVVAAGLASAVAKQPASQPARARARLIAEQTAVVPGTTAWLGVAFDIDPDWHLYWNGVSDTGFAIKLTPDFPAGYTPGEVLWPAPHRHLTENFLDHVYERRVTLLLPVHIPENAKAGETVSLKVDAEWLVCKQACLPGDAQMSLTLPIAATAAASPNAKLFDESRANLPKSMDKSNPEVRIEWGPDSVTLTNSDRSKGMAFYPSLESVTVSDLSVQGESKSDTLHLRLEKPEAGGRLVGVVEIGPGGAGVRKLFAIDCARPALNSNNRGASDPKQPKGG